MYAAGVRILLDERADAYIMIAHISDASLHATESRATLGSCQSPRRKSQVTVSRSSHNTALTIRPITERAMDLLYQGFAAKKGFATGRKPTWLGVAAFLFLCNGCGGPTGTSPVTGQTEQTTSAAPINPDSSDDMKTASFTNDQSAAHVERSRREVWTDEKGQKWFGNVPMDAFFEQPYEVASDSTPISGADPAVVATSDEKKTNIPTTTQEVTTQKPAGTESWNDLISAAEIDEEVKTIRNFLNETLQSVSNYNSSMLMIPPKAATLGALAGVALEHPDAVSWKGDAKYVRDLAKKMNSDTLRSGPKDQKRLLEIYEDLSDTLNRSRPANLEEPPASDGFADVSEMRLLMLRIEEAEKRLKTEAGAESALASRKEMVTHEATLIATLAKIVTLPGYGYEDDPRFRSYAEQVSQAAMAMKTAATDGDFPGFELALTKVSTTCSRCHSDYKNN